MSTQTFNALVIAASGVVLLLAAALFVIGAAQYARRRRKLPQALICAGLSVTCSAASLVILINP